MKERKTCLEHLFSWRRVLYSYKSSSNSQPSGYINHVRRKHHTINMKKPAIILMSCPAVIAFAFLFFSTCAQTIQAPGSVGRPLSSVNHPVVILVSSDGFRFGYQHKTATPNIHKLIDEGVEAKYGLIPVFPTSTFPNHYSIVTGLYPAYHGIVNNYFIDPDTKKIFTEQSHDPEFWLGEPLWQTVVKNGLKAATYFWPGSEVKKNGWDCPPKFCPPYDRGVTFEDRVQAVLSYFDVPNSDDIPSFINLYLSDPDSQGHRFGPDDPRITEAVAHIDAVIGKLISGLHDRKILDDVHIILVGDHGMVGTCDQKLIFLDDLKPGITIPKEWVTYYSPLLSIRPTSTTLSPAEVVAKMNDGLSSGKVTNGQYLKMYLKEKLPERMHYSASKRITPIIGLLEEGFKVEQSNTSQQECGGAHGYDNRFFSMRSIFIGRGPRFAKGRKVDSFENVEIYNVIKSILNLKEGADNNGTDSFADHLLLPPSTTMYVK